MTTLVLDAIGIPTELLTGLPSDCEIAQVAPGTPIPIDLAQRARAWIVDARTAVDGTALDSLPELVAVSKFGAGTDNIAIAEASARRVWVCNTPGVLDDAVAELTLGMIIAAGRHIVSFDGIVRHGGWTGTPPTLTGQIHGSTLGIIGMGSIGRRVAELAAALRMEVLYHNRSRVPASEVRGPAAWCERDQLLLRSDFVSVHVPLTAETRHLIGAAELALMKPSAILINTSRGAVVDQAALVEALRRGQVAGAALDVFDVEPLPVDDPLTRLDNVVLLPHVGSATLHTRTQMRLLALRNAVTAAHGERPVTALNSWPEDDEPSAEAC